MDLDAFDAALRDLDADASLEAAGRAAVRAVSVEAFDDALDTLLREAAEAHFAEPDPPRPSLAPPAPASAQVEEPAPAPVSAQAEAPAPVPEPAPVAPRSSTTLDTLFDDFDDLDGPAAPLALDALRGATPAPAPRPSAAPTAPASVRPAAPSIPPERVDVGVDTDLNFDDLFEDVAVGGNSPLSALPPAVAYLQARSSASVPPPAQAPAAPVGGEPSLEELLELDDDLDLEISIDE